MTETNLLFYLYDYKFQNRFPVIITKEDITHLATYPPKDKDEFIRIKDMGEKKYDACGEMLIDAIEKFINYQA